ncbi:hypothetical protein KUCAC02_014162 [Chaenocephalus aceratus]|uniref:Uncharacterized protein n=1 Tax=Chaenocephalus aceratus TaxID=36190 RepID=A0ACB9WDP6_CHAAC|nr:hypothetical protein KUCAC02_014162 [Chaenocephalus aceratus]
MSLEKTVVKWGRELLDMWVQSGTLPTFWESSMSQISGMLHPGLSEEKGRQENVALRGKASQSGRNPDYYGDANKAIDGSLILTILLVHATAWQTNPWWRVDLLESYIVTSIIITNRADCCAERLNGAEVHIGNPLKDNGVANPV